MYFLVISGIDGSGKTTIINRLEQKLKENGKQTLTIWLRFNHYLVKPVHGFCRIVGLSKKHKTPSGHVWRHEFYKSTLFIWLYINLTYIDTLIGKARLYRKIKRENKHLDYIICDRWINDIVIDLGTKKHDGNFLDTGYYTKFQRILPENTLQFVIFRDQEKLLECRTENREDPDFLLRSELYNKIKLKEGVYILDNSGTIDACVDSILSDLEKHSWNFNN